MHELAVTESILNIATDHAKKAEAQRVTHIYITVGKLSSIVDDSIQFYWDILSKDTLCEASLLHFNRIPAKFLCMDCGHAFTMEGDLTACPECKSMRLKLVSGEEFFLDSIEIEK